jgi:hypothetical protein
VKIYVETNFVMELVLDQEQSGSCEQILVLCAQGRRNFRDFDTPDIMAALRSLNCRMIPRFDQGVRFVQTQIARER